MTSAKMKNSGLNSRMSSVAAALAAAEPSSALETNETTPAITALSVRLPKPMYDSLLDIVYQAKKRGQKISIHSLMLEGIAKVIAERE